MKKLYLLIICCLAALAGNSQIKIGHVTISPILLEERGDSLLLEMDIHIQANAVNKCQSWTILPHLATNNGMEGIRFPHVLINGKRKAQQFRRKTRFENTYLLYNYPEMVTDISRHTDIVLHYRQSIPYQPWMDTASLSLDQILSSCAMKDQWFSLSSISPVKLQPRDPYQVIPHISFAEPQPEVKKRQMQGRAYLDFHVGRSVIDPSYRRNPQELAQINETIRKVQDDKDVEITGLFIEGYASPEGSYALNERLSRDRSLALKDYIRSTFGLPEQMFRVNSVPEDWDGLRVAVQESNLSDKDRILSVIDSPEAPDRKEQRLRAMGATFRTLLNDYFPALRRVEYQIDYTVRDYTLEEAKGLAGKNPEQLSELELYLVAQSYPENSVERRDIFTAASRNYADRATAQINYAAVLLAEGEYGTAKRYLDQAENDPRSYNNIGVYYLLTGDLDQAEAYFEKARLAGIPQAAANLLEVQKKRDDNEKMERYRRR